MVEITKSLVVGQPDDPSTFMSAVIDQRFRANSLALVVLFHTNSHITQVVSQGQWFHTARQS
jgi:hypothetical protein